MKCKKRSVSPDFTFHCDPCALIAEDEFIAAGGDELLVRLADKAAAEDAREGGEER